MNNNSAQISGVVAQQFCYSHTIKQDKVYSSVVIVKRDSGVADRIPVRATEHLLEDKNIRMGSYIYVSGYFRSLNKVDEEGKTHVDLYLYAKEISKTTDTGVDINEILLDGFICKRPFYRQTPLKREVCDILLAVNRPYRKTDYVPCICWGKIARYADYLEVGTRLNIKGRIQSREYEKRLTDTYSETRTAYEVSAQTLSLIEGGTE